MVYCGLDAEMFLWSAPYESPNISERDSRRTSIVVGTLSCWFEKEWQVQHKTKFCFLSLLISQSSGLVKLPTVGADFAD